MKRLFPRFLLAAGTMLLSVASYGQTAINSVPYTISGPGNYVLNKDLIWNSQTGIAISINSGGVTLDFAGHALIAVTFPNINTSSIGVALGTNNKPIDTVTIKNGTIAGFGTGITLGGAEGSPSTFHVVEGMRIINIINVGMTAAQGLVV